MKNFKALLSVTLLLIVSCSAKEVPSLHVVDGTSIELSQLAGKVVLINYWAEWCGPCREEVPIMNAFERANADKVAIFAVNFDGVAGGELIAQAKKIGIAFRLLSVDPRDIFGVAPSGVLPETLVIDQRGNFQKVLLGPQTKQQLEMLLASFTEEVHYNNG